MLEERTPIVAESDLIRTYSPCSQERAFQYLEVMKLRKQNYGVAQICKLSSINKHRVRGWIYKNNQPYPIKTLEMCKKMGWLPLYPSSALARIIGYNMGDGSVQNCLLHTYFCSKSKNQMKKLNMFIKNNFGIFGNVRKQKEEYILSFGSSAFSRLLYCAGCPKGEKTKQIFEVPNWILNPHKYTCNPQESKDIQLAFLQALNDSETCKFSLRKHSLQEIKFEVYTHKYPKQLNFIEQLMHLFNNFNVKTKIFHTLRTDSQCWRIGFRIKGLVNISRFLQNVGFFFNNSRLEYSLNSLSEVCNKRLNILLKRERAFVLRNQGLSYIRISKILNVPPTTICGWYLKNKKPLYFDQKVNLQKILEHMR